MAYTGRMKFPPLRFNLFTLLLLALGAGAGFLFSWIGTPLPFMLGALAVSAVAAMGFSRHFPAGYTYPLPFRQLFVGVIGVMIGAQVSPELLSLIPTLWISIPAVLLFVVLAHGLNFLLFRRLGRFDRATAFYAGSPGGLLEAIAFGEEAGADIRLLTIMQFLRIIVVVAILPFAISLYEGTPVGSAAGLAVVGGSAGILDVGLVLLFSVVGVRLGTLARVPAAQLVGPLFVVGLGSAFGLIDLAIPPWLIGLAQIVVGISLGLRFSGITRRMLMSGLGLAVLSGAMMLGLGAALSVGVARLTGFDIETLIICFAPGGVTEMSLVALSLAISPTFVTLHHLVRILATVFELGIVRRLGWI